MDQSGAANRKRRFSRPQAPGTPIRQNATRLGLPREQKHDKISHPSHKQMARLVSYMCPPRFLPAIISTMEQLVQNSKVGNDCRISDVAKVGKTPVAWIIECIPNELGSCMVTEADSINVMEMQVHGVLMECVLNRISKGKQFCYKKESDMSESIHLLKYTRDEGTDDQWSTVLLFLPHPSTFYVAHQGGAVGNEESGFNGMPASWLRIHRRYGQPAKGAFIKSIKRCFYIQLEQPQKISLPCYQMNDYENGSPVFPPDIFDGIPVLHPNQRQKQYNARVHKAESNGSFRYGCRRYIPGAHHKRIDGGVL